MAKKIEIRNSTAEFLTFVAAGKEDRLFRSDFDRLSDSDIPTIDIE